MFVFGNSFGLMALRQEEAFQIYWMIAYKLMYAEFEDDYETHEERTYFVISTIIGSLVMLNFIIAIISDLYDEC